MHCRPCILTVALAAALPAPGWSADAVRVEPSTHPFVVHQAPDKASPRAERAAHALKQATMPLFGLQAHYDNEGRLTMHCHLDRPAFVPERPDIVEQQP